MRLSRNQRWLTSSLIDCSVYAVVGVRMTVCLYKDDCLAQAQAGKAQISFADHWGGETVPCRVFTRCSQLADRLPGYPCTGSSEQSRPLVVLHWG